jgi:mRNA-degrading endonuclease RelE of RelBE toxin-antitoxin system
VTKIFHDIRYLPEFTKDLKKLKKFFTLKSDIDTFIHTVLKVYHKEKIKLSSIVQISGLGIESPLIYKVKKFACKALKGKGAASGIRIIYAYYEQDDIIEFIEIYYKGKKENEDRERIFKHYGKGRSETTKGFQASG